MARLLFFFIVFTNLSVFSQQQFTGRIIDKTNGEPMPFTFLIKKSTQTGAITNLDGYFELKANPADTVIISFVGYQTAEVPVVYFSKKADYFLRQKVNMLGTVNVVGNASVNQYLKVLKIARKKLAASKPYQSKTYFTLESNHNDAPIELLECYYNADLNKQGLHNLALKNGRIGLAELDQTYFVSLHTTFVMENFDLLYKKDSEFPFHPLHFNIRKLKQLYDIKLVNLNDDLFVLQFTPKQEVTKLFSSKIWVDRKLENLLKIEVWQSNLTKHPFLEIDAKHNMDSLSFKLAYTFDNSERQMINKIEIDYDFNYDNLVKSRHINSSGIFLFYEKDAAFELPFNDFNLNGLSDYDKIVSQPYNALFWRYNEVLSPSDKVEQSKQFFKDYGVLLNYTQLTPYNKLFNSRIVQWDTARLDLKDINPKYGYQVRPNVVSAGRFVATISELYEFRYTIYLDKNYFADSSFYTTATLIDKKESFYYLTRNRFTQAIVNMVFDLVETERRKLEVVLNSQPWTANQVDSIYQKTIESANNNVSLLLKETEHGNTVEPTLIYVNNIDVALNVNNKRLISDEDRVNKDSTTDSYLVEVYNLGSVLMTAKKYQRAIEIYQTGEKKGDKHPWLLYNMAVCYYQLNKMEEACTYFQKAIDEGEIVEEMYLKKCNFQIKPE